MKSTRQLRLRLRLIEGALLILFGILTAGAVATRQLLLDAADHPTTDISLSSAHWTGTLDAARLPASVPLLSGTSLGLPGDIVFGSGQARLNADVGGDVVFYPQDGGAFVFHGLLYSTGGLSVLTINSDYGAFSSDGSGNVTATSFAGDGSALTGYAPDLLAAALISANSFNALFHLGGNNLDTSLPGDGTASFANGNFISDASGNVSVWSISLSSSGSFLGDDGSASFANGNITFAADGSASLVGGDASIDSTGNVYATSFDTSFGGAAINLDGSATLASLTDSNGDPIFDSGGYLYTGSQSYQSGTVTPTGYLTIKDATGSVYLVPAVRQP